jgi:hypothetical protein
MFRKTPNCTRLYVAEVRDLSGLLCTCVLFEILHKCMFPHRTFRKKEANNENRFCTRGDHEAKESILNYTAVT